MQMWYCENEDCGVCINHERYQCSGCGGWFCANCSQSFRGTVFRVCHECLNVWRNLVQVFEQACCSLCGKAREDPDDLLCRACCRLMRGEVS